MNSNVSTEWYLHMYMGYGDCSNDIFIFIKFFWLSSHINVLYIETVYIYMYIYMCVCVCVN